MTSQVDDFRPMLPGQVGRTSVRRHLALGLLLLLGFFVAEFMSLVPVAPPDVHLMIYFFLKHDHSTLWLGALLLLACSLGASQVSVRRDLLARLADSRVFLWGTIAAVAAVVMAGRHLLFFAIPLTYDEIQVEADSAAMLAGQVPYPVAEGWRSLLPAMKASFYLNMPGDRAWISSYWPGNAALHALAKATLGEAWARPILLAVAIASTFSVARRLWPSRPDAAVVAVLLLATSSQVLVLGMTPYAMTSHLAINMLWLALFLRDTPRSHAAAILVGVLGTSLHQVVFHPMFVAPFVVMLLLQRRTLLAFAYGGAYALILVGWVLYPVVLVWLQNPEAGFGDPLRAFFVDRYGSKIGDNTFGHHTMVRHLFLNASRFFAWENPLLMVMLPVGSWLALRSGTAVQRALLASVVLTWGAAAVILPDQGHGWGFRYVHGLIGSMVLLSVVAWVRLVNDETLQRRTASLVIACLGAVLVLLPRHALEVRSVTAPVAEAVTLLEQAPYDIVVLDDSGLSVGRDLVRNPPDLSRRSKTLYLDFMTPEMIRDVCGRGSVAVFDAVTAGRLGLFSITTDGRTPKVTPLRTLLDQTCQPPRL